jgi:hypothetical protein
MAGKIKKAIDEIIYQRSKGIPVIASTIKTKLVIKGINLDIPKMIRRMTLQFLKKSIWL